MLDLVDELRKLVRALEDHRIEYALCGGMAMGVHGRARATIDIDLLILSESLPEVIEIAKALGYNIRGKDLSFANGAVEIRRVSKIDSDDGELLSLDLLLATPDIRDVWESRIEVEWEGGKLSVVSASGLIALKQLRRSYQDLADIEALTSGSFHEEG
jgi:nucleotidyltransferase AbiEii toxin of type IV toxin-antitoxin system